MRQSLGEISHIYSGDQAQGCSEATRVSTGNTARWVIILSRVHDIAMMKQHN